MKNQEQLLRMLVTHVYNVTALMDDAQIFLMVSYNDVGASRRSWFARGALRKEVLTRGLNPAQGDEIQDVTDKPEVVLGLPSKRRRRSSTVATYNECELKDPCPGRPRLGDKTMNRIAVEDDERSEINCYSEDEEELDDVDAFNILVQGDEESSAFDGLRSVQPVVEDEMDILGLQGISIPITVPTLSLTGLTPSTTTIFAPLQTSLPHSTTTSVIHSLQLRPDLAGPDQQPKMTMEDLDLLSCVDLGKEETVESALPAKETTLPAMTQQKKSPKKKMINDKNPKTAGAPSSKDPLQTKVSVDGKMMDLRSGPKVKVGTSSPVWKFFGFLFMDGVEQFQGFVACRLCLKRVSRAGHNTKGMRDHLEIWHEQAWARMCEEEWEARSEPKPVRPKRTVKLSTKRWQPTDAEMTILARHYRREEFPDASGYSQIAEQLGKPTLAIKQWFTNQRRRGFPARRFLTMTEFSAQDPHSNPT